ncbi:MAG: response regulator, partial [Formosimonas sp.]
MNIQPSVLIVEDEDDIAELLRFGLSRAGFATEWAKDLASARAAVKKVLPDVVILDWMLPDGEGVAWLTELRRDQRCATLPILM